MKTDVKKNRIFCCAMLLVYIYEQAVRETMSREAPLRGSEHCYTYIPYPGYFQPAS